MDEEAMGVRDEIGFLTMRQHDGDRLFPGAAVLYTQRPLPALRGPAGMMITG
jgi:hypothetical protein